MTIDNWGIGFADDFKYNYTEVRLFKGFVKISAEGAQQLSIIHCQLSICDKIAKSGFIDKLKALCYLTEGFLIIKSIFKRFAEAFRNFVNNDFPVRS